jgi:enoyl-CoA hydratase/carnithine racemase
VPIDDVLTARLPVRGAAALWRELAAIGRSLSGAVRVVVLRGAGADFFADDKAPDDDGSDVSPLAGQSIGWLRRPDLITIAAVSGRATGIGLHVALACDLRIGADDALLAVSSTERKAGRDELYRQWQFDAGGAARLVELLGYPRALELVLTGGRLTGREAADLGLFNRVVPATELDAGIAALIDAVLTVPWATATQAKALMAAASDHVRRRTDEVAAGIRLATGEV